MNVLNNRRICLLDQIERENCFIILDIVQKSHILISLMDNLGILEQQAIDAAIANNWELAIELNNKIAKQDKTNIGAFLRLGFAYLQTSQIDSAANAYREALKIQPKNHIALENMERIRILQKQSANGSQKERKNLDPNLFLDVPGKTKTVQLVNLGQKVHLAELSIGQELELKIKKRKIEVRTLSGTYVGALPDDISKRIIYFLEEESEYRTYIKEASLSRILVFIKEVLKGDKVKDFVSFPQSASPMYHPLTPSEGEESEDEEVKDGEDSDDWEAEENEDDEEKHDLLHINTQEDEEESEE